MSTPPPSSTVPDESKPVGPRNWRKEIGAGVTVAAGSIPNELSYGLLAMAPLGLAMEGRGILAAMLAGMLGTLVALSLGSRVGQIHGARPALALIVSALIGHTLIKANWLPGIPHQDGALILMGLALAGAALLQLTTAAAGWGRFVRYIPYPVQAGFFNGVALLMLLGGLKLVFMQGGTCHPARRWWRRSSCCPASCCSNAGRSGLSCPCCCVSAHCCITHWLHAAWRWA